MAWPAPFAPFQNKDVGATMDQEAVVNGFWAGILASYFPYPNYIVAPEFWSSSTKRGDLFVIPVGHTEYKPKSPILAFEGKKPLTPLDFEKAGGQLDSYLQNITKTGN
jgi:hypothetical protein